MKLDKATLALIASIIAAAFGGGNMVGGSTAVDAIQRDVTDIRERVARVEAMLEQKRFVGRAQ